MAFVFGLQTLLLIDSSKIYQLKGLKPKNKSHTNFYECCDLTKNVYLIQAYRYVDSLHAWQVLNRLTGKGRKNCGKNFY